MTTTHGLPVPARGKHRQPTDGSCLMEYVSVLAGQRFTDRPRCTHPLLAWLARRVNDVVDDPTRARLITLAPSLIGTRTRHPAIRGIVLGHLASAGLAASPHDPWLTRLAALAAATDPSSRWHLQIGIDRNRAFTATEEALEVLPVAARDVLWSAALAGAVADARARLAPSTTPAVDPVVVGP